MLDTSTTHKTNGLVQESMHLNTGFTITISIATGVCGESSCISIIDKNIYPDNDNRSERPKEYIIPIDFADDMKEISDVISKAIKKRNLTKIKSSGR
jgi:hypothetical protein